MSELKVDKITPRQGTTLTLGDSGDTINFGSGVLPNFENLTVTGDLTVDTNSLKVDSTNNFVGIGTASPAVALDVVGAITATGNITGTLATAAQPNITSVGTLTSATVSGDLTVDTDTLHVDSSNNRVGVGTSSPSYPLHIVNSSGGFDSVIEATDTTTFLSLVASDGSVGFGAVGAGQIQFRVGGDAGSPNGQSEAMRIDSSGNVLVGKTSQGSATAGGEILASGTVLGTRDGSTAGRFNRLTSHGDIVDFRKDNTVIATIGSVSSNPYFANNNGDSVVLQNNALRPGNSTGANQDNVIDLGVSSSRFNDAHFGGTINAVTITATGNLTSLGIDDNATTTSLTISSDGRTTLDATNEKPLVVHHTDGNEVKLGFQNNAGNASYMSLDSSDFTFNQVGSETMRIASNGNVGIGTSSPDGLLNLVHKTSSSTISEDASDYALTFNFAGSSGDYGRHIAIRDNNGDAVSAIGGIDQGTGGSTGLYFATGSASSLNEAMRIASNGDVGIGTASITNYQLAVSGTIVGTFVETTSTTAGHETIIVKRPNAGTQMAFLSPSNVGSITVTSSATSYNTSSDYRLKENVVDMTGATERLKQLSPKRFNFIADADTTVDGFLAHEVSNIVPEAISGTKDEVDDEGNPVYQGIDQSKLVPLLVATIKELEARIEALENA